MEATWAEMVLMTADQLLVMPEDKWRYELIEGRLVRISPTGYSHNRLSAKLFLRVAIFVESHGLGVVLGQEAGFLLSRPDEPDTVLAPDLAFVRAGRTPPEGFTGYPRLAPDLVAEVISPSQSHDQLRQKAAVWLHYGVPLVWLVLPEMRQVEVCQTEGESVMLNEGDVLNGGDILPGLNIPLTSIFAA